MSTLTISIVAVGVLFITMSGQSFNIEEATIKQIRQAFTQNKLTSRQLVDFYLHQIQTLNPLLRAIIEVNPDAQILADVADEERERNRNRDGGSLGELHGIPVLLKDAIGTKDKLNTTGGSYALLGSEVPRDAGVVERLRKAGAVILGKTSMSEWYKFRSLSGVPDGWCARAGQGVNPYVHSGSPCGSSSGSAIAVTANMVAVSLGTETHSSISCPADHNSIVGLKPTVGLTSRAGVIPMTLDGILLGFDPRDEATREAAKYIPEDGYKQFLNVDGLSGKRLGIVRSPFLDKLNGSAEVVAFDRHVNTLRERGATVVENLNIAHIEKILDPHLSGELEVMLAEFKISINAYLKDLINSSVRSLADIIAFNQNNSELEKLGEYDQKTLIASEETDGFGEDERKAVEILQNLSENGFEKLMKKNELDAMVTPGSRAIAVLAIGGYPAITVPAGYGTDGTPFGIGFGGLKGTEPKLIEIAYAFEQATMVRTPPFSSMSMVVNKVSAGV